MAAEIINFNQNSRDSYMGKYGFTQEILWKHKYCHINTHNPTSEAQKML